MLKAPRLKNKITNFKRKTVDELRAFLTSHGLQIAVLKPALVIRLVIWELGLSRVPHAYDLEIRAKDLGSKQVVELRTILEQHSIAVYGNKADLIGEILLEESSQPGLTAEFGPIRLFSIVLRCP